MGRTGPTSFDFKRRTMSERQNPRALHSWKPVRTIYLVVELNIEDLNARSMRADTGMTWGRHGEVDMPSATVDFASVRKVFKVEPLFLLTQDANEERRRMRLWERIGVRSWIGKSRRKPDNEEDLTEKNDYNWVETIISSILHFLSLIRYSPIRSSTGEASLQRDFPKLFPDPARPKGTAFKIISREQLNIQDDVYHPRVSRRQEFEIPAVGTIPIKEDVDERYRQISTDTEKGQSHDTLHRDALNGWTKSLNTIDLRNSLSHNTQPSRNGRPEKVSFKFGFVTKAFESPRIKRKNALCITSILEFLVLVCLIAVFSPLQGVGATLTVIPRNVLVPSGSIARLLCSTDHGSPIYWERIAFGSNHQQTIYYGKNGMGLIPGGRIMVDKNPDVGRYDLVVKDVQPEDAGTYICVDEAGIGDGYRAELVVSETFTCNMTSPHNGFMGENIFDIPEDTIDATCKLTFRGNVVPRFQWSLENTTHIEALTQTKGSTVSSSVTQRATHKMDGARLTCLPSVSNDSSSHDDQHWWSSQPVSIRYVSLQFGTVDECQGSSMTPVCNPICTYQFDKTSDSKCSCLAIYDSEGITYNKTFNEYDCDESVLFKETWFIVTATIGLGIFVATVSLGILFCFHRKQLLNRAVAENHTEPEDGRNSQVNHEPGEASGLTDDNSKPIRNSQPKPCKFYVMLKSLSKD